MLNILRSQLSPRAKLAEQRHALLEQLVGLPDQTLT